MSTQFTEEIIAKFEENFRKIQKNAPEEFIEMAVSFFESGVYSGIGSFISTLDANSENEKAQQAFLNDVIDSIEFKTKGVQI
jgi:uncharacterized protein YyaL (SSP411 family)